jgi:hypothetical protein
MRTIKFLFFTAIAVVTLASCDMEVYSKKVEGTAPEISFSTGAASNLPAGYKASKVAVNGDSTIYSSSVSNKFISEKLDEYGLDMENIKSLSITKATLKLPKADVATAKKFKNVKFYVGDVLVAQQEGDITGTSVELTIKDANVLSTVTSKEGNYAVKITTGVDPITLVRISIPTNISLVLVYDYQADIAAYLKNIF